MSRERVSEIEDAIAAGKMTAAQVFTQMRQLIPAQAASSTQAGDWMVLAGLLDERAADRGGDKLLTEAADALRLANSTTPEAASSTQAGDLLATIDKLGLALLEDDFTEAKAAWFEVRRLASSTTPASTEGLRLLETMHRLGCDQAARTHVATLLGVPENRVHSRDVADAVAYFTAPPATRAPVVDEAMVPYEPTDAMILAAQGNDGTPLDGPPMTPQDAAVVRDPHHDQLCEWRWEKGQLFHRLYGQKNWVKVNRVHVTPARILAIAKALQLSGYKGA